MRETPFGRDEHRMGVRQRLRFAAIALPLLGVFGGVPWILGVQAGTLTVVVSTLMLTALARVWSVDVVRPPDRCSEDEGGPGTHFGVTGGLGGDSAATYGAVIVGVLVVGLMTQRPASATVWTSDCRSDDAPTRRSIDPVDLGPVPLVIPDAQGLHASVADRASAALRPDGPQGTAGVDSIGAAGIGGAGSEAGEDGTDGLNRADGAGAPMGAIVADGATGPAGAMITDATAETDATEGIRGDLAAKRVAEETGSSALDVPPPLIPYRGVITDSSGEPLVGLVSAIFALYEEPSGGVPLWVDIKAVEAGAAGGYTVLLGGTTELPVDLFATGEIRWLGVQPEGEAEQPRVRFTGVPDALKARDTDDLNDDTTPVTTTATVSDAEDGEAGVVPPRRPSAGGEYAIQVAASSNGASATGLVDRLLEQNDLAYLIAPRPGDEPALAAVLVGAGAAAAGTYGPVTATDTLWSLAERFRSDETVSVQRMMLALLEANSEAFSVQNVSALKVGAVLRIPTRAEIGPDAKSEALVTVRRQYAAWDAYRGSGVGHVSPDPPPAEPIPEAASPPPERPAVTEAAILEAVPPDVVTPPPPASIPDSLPAALPVSLVRISGPAGLVLVIVGAVALVRRRRAAREVDGEVALAAGVEETGSLIERDAATEMPAVGSDDATVVPAAVLDFDSIDAVLENAPSFRDPGARRPDDGEDAELRGGGEPAPADDDDVDPRVVQARYRPVDDSAGPVSDVLASDAVRRARLAWANEDRCGTRRGRAPETPAPARVPIRSTRASAIQWGTGVYKYN